MQNFNHILYQIPCHTILGIFLKVDLEWWWGHYSISQTDFELIQFLEVIIQFAVFFIYGFDAFLISGFLLFKGRNVIKNFFVH